MSSQTLDGSDTLKAAMRVTSPACFAMAHSLDEATTISRRGLSPTHLWQPARHLLLIDQTVKQAIADSRDDRPKLIIVEAPPRHGKSEYFSKYLPTWYLGRYPDNRVILTTYADTLCRKFGRSIRALIDQRADWFGVGGIKHEVRAANEFEVAGFEGGFLGAGVGGPITGRGADLLIIDDPIKNAEEALSQTVRDSHWDWFQSTAWTRLEPGACCVVMMTRWHEDDLAGRILSKREELGDVEIVRLRFPALAEAEGDLLGRAEGDALWPERWPKEKLEQRRELIEPAWWSAMFQQKPGQFGRAEWPDEYFREPFWCEDHEWPDKFQVSAIALDPSKGRDTGDPCGIVFMGLTRGLLWVDSVVDRLPAPAMCSRLVEMFMEHGADAVAVEENAFQYLLADTIKAAQQKHPMCGPLPLQLVNNRVNKELRIGRLGPYLAQHSFRFRRSKGNATLVGQLKAFPLGDHDDGPDAMENALRTLDAIVRRGK